MSKDKFVFFWKKNSCFSQWYPSEFKGVPIFSPKKEELEFKNCEQWMMYHKALLFGDNKIADKIIETDNPSTIKKLGRKVSNFDPITWEQNREQIVLMGNYLKFSQNPKLKEELIETYPSKLVEASPYDTIWGIGFSKNHPNAQDETKWRGKNLLGKILNQVRDMLINNS